MVKEKSPPTTEVKKMKQGMSYSTKEKTIIMNVFKYFRSQYPEKNVTEIIRRTSKATGCSEKSIFSFRKEEHSPEGFKEPSKTKIRKKANINSRLIKYNETIRGVIRNVIYDLKRNNIIPSLNIILKSLNTNNGIPKFSLMTLRRLLSDMGFYYEKSGNKSVLVEKGGSDESFHKTSNRGILPQHSVSNENFPSKANHIQSNKLPARTLSPINDGNQGEAHNGQKSMPLIKMNHSNSQSFVQKHLDIYKGSVMGHYGNSLGHSHESNINNLSTHSPPQISMMFPPRMTPYHHIHSTGQSSVLQNKELYLKEIQPLTCHPSQLSVRHT